MEIDFLKTQKDEKSSKIEVEKFNIDELNNKSSDMKKLMANELGIKVNGNEEVLTMQYQGINEDGTPEIKLRKSKFSFDWLRDFTSEMGKEFLIGILFSIFMFLNFREVYDFYLAVSTLDLAYTNLDNILFEMLVMIMPLIIWAVSTNLQFYNFRNKKLLMFGVSYWLINFMLLRVTYIISYSIFVPFISKIQPTAEMTVSKIIGLAYISTFVPMGLVLILLFTIASRATALNKDFIKAVEKFRLFKVMDLEFHSKHEYIFKVVRDIENGAHIAISQVERQMHTAIIGATGTAKTSSVLLQSIYHDLMVRVTNKNYLKKAMRHFTKKGLFRMIQEFEDIDFSPKYFEPSPDYKVTLLDRLIGRNPKRIYDDLVKKYEIAGQTILAPEDSLTDDAYDLFTAYGEKVNRVDPKRIDGKLKPGFKGINILFISPNMPSWAVDREKVRRATLLADVMQIMFEMGGKSDPYFASVNRIATTTIALILQLTYPEMKGRQPNLIDVQNCLNDFKKLIEPYQFLFPNGRVNEKNIKYQWLKDNITNFFLGEGAETFEQHARGLKVQFSLFLADDYVRDLVSADDCIDFDGMLANNELTVVNIELPEIGPMNAPALGLFFSVNMTNAVLRRPGNEWTRSFHAWKIDEFPIIVTPSMEQAFTLFRKFKVAMEVALQTLDQMEKTPFLKYLKGVILNSTANQIVFGRSNISEMEIYSALSGVIEDVIDMEGITETSLFTENPTVSFQHRKTKAISNVNEMSDIRNKDFQEVTYFYTKRGAVMPPKYGKVEFLSKKQKRGPKKIKRYDWKALYRETSKDSIGNKPVLKFSDEQLKKARLEEDKVSEVLIKRKAAEVPESVIDLITEPLDNEVVGDENKSVELSEDNPPHLDDSLKGAAEPLRESNEDVIVDAISEIEIEGVKSQNQESQVLEELEITNTKAPPLDSKEARELKRKEKFDFF